ncbi:hypothetical protein [Cellulomonas pakistanensis]|uniref:Lipoprotein n=1 Tax=Cellulomonas pakistanensis TaxID=992287 RepID=A0A919P9S9_9CELL|nr:hypothetical protein [Cellulomonas pakistanensis]GIG36253.1 hypothetical protein Cpa01nite_16340 [Cellulomonas pakistanensis]
MTARKHRRAGPRARATGVSACALAVALLAGCVIDHPRPRLTYVNDSGTTVLVTVQMAGGELTREQEVPAGDATDLSLAECEDESGLSVATPDGAVVGTIDGPLCPGGVLFVTDGMTLEYDPDAQNRTERQ